MGLLRTRELRLERSADPLWWATAAVLGLASLWLPSALQLRGDRWTETFVVEGALFFSGALVGAFRPNRVWRWGVAAFLAFTLDDLARLANDPRFNLIMREQVADRLLEQVSISGLNALSVVAGAYVGSLLTSRGMR